MKRISAATARALATFQGDTLNLGAVTALDAEIVTTLADFKGGVRLPVDVLAARIGPGVPLTPATVRLLCASAPGQEIPLSNGFPRRRSTFSPRTRPLPSSFRLATRWNSSPAPAARMTTS